MTNAMSFLSQNDGNLCSFIYIYYFDNFKCWACNNGHIEDLYHESIFNPNHAILI